MTEHDPSQAQQQLEKAVDLARVSNMSTTSRSKNHLHQDDHYSTKEALLDQVETGRGMVSVRYEHSRDIHNGSGKDSTYSEVDVDEGSRSYVADLHDRNGKIWSRAGVLRPHGDYLFAEKHAEKAAALITSLAAKRLGERATQHADKLVEDITVARDALHSKQN